MSPTEATEAPAGPVRSGRQRDPGADDAILAATLAVLAEGGYGALTVAAVIERAGVSSATLYRRWPAKHELVAAAIASLAPQPLVVDEGSLARDVAAFVRLLGQAMEAREAVVDQLVLDMHLNPELAAALREKLVAPRLSVLEGILERAVARGELTRHPSVDVVFSLVAGPVYHRAVGMGDTLSPAFLRAVAAHALHGLLGGPERDPGRRPPAR